jgi:hypothetical protein
LDPRTPPLLLFRKKISFFSLFSKVLARALSLDLVSYPETGRLRLPLGNP